MHQFFVKKNDISYQSIKITNKTDIDHITKVLRLSCGDKIFLVEQNAFKYLCKIQEITSNYIETIILEKIPFLNKLNINMTLAQSIIKSTKQDILIQKANELDTNKIIPLITKNTVVKFDSDKDKLHKISRWQKIAAESSKQCKRSDICEILPISTLVEVINLPDYDLKFCCSEKDAEKSLKIILSQHPTAKNILVIIGPEGGWDDSEIELFKKNNIPLISLGNLILRAETAAISILSNIVYEYEL
ncbi:MAG: RsmE family RNA methyltransferase [Candidatus Gastranaerophilales bacterium]|nr:RsmE family RNA methyltransferase [Candidatus Gastranaerophilales bacterium]